MTAVPTNAGEQFELETQTLEGAQAEVQAKLQARQDLLHTFEKLAESAESDLAQGQVPMASIAKLNALEQKIHSLDQALTGILEQVAEKIAGLSQPI
jgi:hypothetical protein